MTTDKPTATGTRDVTQTQGREASQRPQTTRAEAAAMVPAVDIFENQDGILLVADMPGVAPDGVEVEVEHQVLTIAGNIDVDMPAGLHATYAELRGTRYARRFTLSNELDPQRIEASVGNGVLTLRLPKKEAHKPRRIEIKAG